MKRIPVLETISPNDIVALLRRLENRQLEEDDYPTLVKLIRLLQTVQSELETKRTTIATLRRLLFGPRSEKQKLAALPEEANPVSIPVPETVLPTPDPDPTEKESETTTAAKVVSLDRKRRKGHGRLGAAAYTGAKVVTCVHDLKPKDPCPDPLCGGHLYDTGTPQLFIRLEGRPPVDATKFELPTLRCSACQERFAAPLPKEVKPEKYDPSADVVMALLKYGASVPFYRLERLQRMLGIPLPASTQFERCEAVADALLPVYLELQKQAAAGDTWFVDDTWQRILACLKENQSLSEKERTGTFTTGVVAMVEGREVALYFSGRRHAGENLALLHRLRPAGLPVPRVMADAEAKNWSSDFEKLVMKCLVHGRRQFVEIAPNFPADSKRVLDDLAAVYRFEAETKGMTPEARLAHHQKHSQPVLESLKSWMEIKLDLREVEPAGGLGKAFSYMRRHWDHLTQFLRVPGAAIDNNAAERILRPVVINRRNALFFKTEHGAAVADVLCSIIQSCALNRVNAFAYLVAVLRHRREVQGSPAAWPPWNYQEQLRRKAAEPSRTDRQFSPGFLNLGLGGIALGEQHLDVVRRHRCQ